MLGPTEGMWSVGVASTGEDSVASGQQLLGDVAAAVAEGAGDRVPVGLVVPGSTPFLVFRIY
jgi:hypothetical protein